MHLKKNSFSARWLVGCILGLGTLWTSFGAVESLPADQRRNGKDTLKAFDQSADASLASTV
ncbi:uncharacterized protein METZ01_LOCUS506114, partial [marine metagenome]